MENYYEILNVMNFAEEEVIKASYKALAKKYHPDINKSIDPNIIVKINNAYDILSNSVEKEKYDEKLRKYLSEKTNEEYKKSNDGANEYTTYKQNKDNASYSHNYEDYNDGDDDYENDKKPKFFIVRSILSIVITFILGIIVSSFLVVFLSEDGSWSYILYSFFGSMIGFLIRKISGSDKPLLAVFSAIITLMCIVLPYYAYLYDNARALFGNLSDTELFFNIIKEIVSNLLGSGIIRMVFVLMAPVMAFEYVSDAD